MFFFQFDISSKSIPWSFISFTRDFSARLSKFIKVIILNQNLCYLIILLLQGRAYEQFGKADLKPKRVRVSKRINYTLSTVTHPKNINLPKLIWYEHYFTDLFCFSLTTIVFSQFYDEMTLRGTPKSPVVRVSLNVF